MSPSGRAGARGKAVPVTLGCSNRWSDVASKRTEMPGHSGRGNVPGFHYGWAHVFSGDDWRECVYLKVAGRICW